MDAALADLLGTLGQATDAEYAAFWIRTPGRRGLERAAWPAGRRQRQRTDHVVPVRGAGADLGGPGWVVLAKPGGMPLDQSEERLLAQAACCVGLLFGGLQLDAELERRVRRRRELDAALEEAPSLLEVARATERRRGITDVLAAIAPPLAQLGRSARECAAALTADPAAARIAGRDLGGSLDELIDRFRLVVRGVHSTILHEHGLATALQEFAVDLPRPLRLVGRPPAELHPEVASVLYQVVVSTLQAMAGTGSGLMTLSFNDAGGYVAVQVEGLVEAPTRLMAVLTGAAVQLEAVGGRFTGDVDEAGSLRVDLSVPDRLRPPVEPFGPDAAAGSAVPTSLLARVRALCGTAVAAYGHRPGGVQLAAAARRLDEAVRVAVTGAPEAAVMVAAALGRHLGPSAQVVPGPDESADVVVLVLDPTGKPDDGLDRMADARLPGEPGGPYPLVVVDTSIDRVQRRRHDGSGRYGVRTGIIRVDVGLEVAAAGLTEADYRALLTLASPEPAGSASPPSSTGSAGPDRLDRLGPAGVRAGLAAIWSGTANDSASLALALTQAGGRADLLALLDVHIRARSEVLRSRTALRVVRTILQRHPPPAGTSALLLREVEDIGAQAYELVELDALTALRTGAAALPAGCVAEAERLLGAVGSSAQARFGLGPGAGEAEVRVAASEHLVRWSRRAGHHVGGRAGQEVCRAAVRTCESVLAAGLTPG